VKYVVREGFPQDHYGACTYCGKTAHKATMEAGKLHGEPARFCPTCVTNLKNLIARFS
jgi:hypothetical protein